MAKVSVIIPVYNVEPWLAQCLDSIVGQTLRDVEIICVNDGSSDRSPDILRDYASRDARIRIIDQENGGLSVARNSGMDVASGDYLYFIDSDDMLEKNALEELVAKADAEKLDILFFDAQSFSDDGSELPTGYSYIRENDYSQVYTGIELMAKLNANREYRPSCCLEIWRRGFIEEHGMRFMPGLIHEDNPFTFRALLKARRASHTPGQYYLRRYREGSIMTTRRSTVHATGLFVGFMQMLNERANVAVPEEYVKEIDLVVAKVFFGAVNEYWLLDSDQKCALDWRGYDSYAGFFDTMVLRMWDMYQSEEAIELRRTPYHSDKLAAGLRGDIARRKAVIKAIEESHSFRIGRVVTWPIRMARGVKTTMQTEGLGATVKKVGRKLRLTGRAGNDISALKKENAALKAEVKRLTRLQSGQGGGGK